MRVEKSIWRATRRERHHSAGSRALQHLLISPIPHCLLHAHLPTIVTTETASATTAANTPPPKAQSPNTPDPPPYSSAPCVCHLPILSYLSRLKDLRVRRRFFCGGPPPCCMELEVSMGKRGAGSTHVVRGLLDHELQLQRRLAHGPLVQVLG